MSRTKLAILLAIKAKRTWDRIPPEHRARLIESTKTTVRTHGPIVAKKAADTARKQAPVIARRVSEALERARRSLR